MEARENGAPRGSQGIGWKARHDEGYQLLLRKPTLYELEGYEDYRAEREKVIAAIPTCDLDLHRHPLDAYEHLDDVVLHAHIFAGGWDWYVASYDPAYDVAYGFVSGADCEWGSFCLREAEAVKHPLLLVDAATGTETHIPDAYHPEVELHWKPITYRELKEKQPSLLRRGAV